MEDGESICTPCADYAVNTCCCQVLYHVGAGAVLEEAGVVSPSRLTILYVMYSIAKSPLPALMNCSNGSVIAERHSKVSRGSVAHLSLSCLMDAVITL